ncbi:MAG: flagellar hook-length control protein FliK, partial [Clostridiaceae bacterium]|nr:flagellar hook-length control protein FliK [Clostridiaceae bacterium]
TKLMNETKANATLLDNNTTYTKEVHSKNILEQVIHKVDTIYKSGKNQLSLQLTPENLGKLSIKLISENNDIKAKVYVESLQVKEVIENNLNQLRDSLREKGIYIGSLEVSVGGDGEDFQKDRHLASNPFRIKSKGKETDINNSIRAIENITSQAVTNPYMLNSQFDKLV